MSVATDTFVNMQGGLQSPPTHSFVITPSDTTELPFVTRAVYVGAAGDITARLEYRLGDIQGGAGWLDAANTRPANLRDRDHGRVAAGGDLLAPLTINPPLRLAQLLFRRA
jgi:hypothetical protein